MTQAEKLEALVRRAIENGWRPSSLEFKLSEVRTRFPFHGLLVGFKTKQASATIFGYNWEPIEIPVSELIFNHEFARALFGEEQRYCLNPDCFQEKSHPNGSCDIGYGFDLHAFEFHLQQAVISKDPIGYMYGAVFE